MTATTSLLVCGKFHYFNYVEELARQGHLRQFIFSHKWGAHRRFSGLFEARNLWLKEYLYHAHMRYIGERGLPTGSRFYHAVWDMAACRALKPCGLLHFLMHGNCVRAIHRAREQGSVLLAEAVNSHPSDYTQIIYEEMDRLGIQKRRKIGINLEAMAIERELADFILVPSGFVQASYERHGVPARKIIKLPYGANLAEFRPANASGKTKTFKVVCMAQVSARKGHYYLLKAWKKLKLKDAALHCYGFRDREVLKALRGLNVPDVFFHGSVSKREVIAALQSANLFVLPTIEEGMAVSILEALSAGLPVVTTTHSGGSEVIEEGREGFVVPPRNVEALAEKVFYFYQNREAAEEMGQAARRKVEAGWGWESYANKLAKIYNEMIPSNESRNLKSAL